MWQDGAKERAPFESRYETRSFAPPAAREARGQTGAKVGFKHTFTLRQHLRSASFTAPLPRARCYCPAFSAFATATRTCQRIWCHAVVGREARPLLSTPGSAARGVEQIEMGMPHRGQLALQSKPCQMMLLQKPMKAAQDISEWSWFSKLQKATLLSSSVPEVIEDGRTQGSPCFAAVVMHPCKLDG